jgi:hypothetical protein
VTRLRALTGNVYAGAADALSSQVPNLELPIVLESHNAQLVKELREALAQERQRTAEAGPISDAERRELERLREKERKRARFQRRADRQRDRQVKRGRRGRGRK